MKRIYIDMDNVIVDYDTAMHNVSFFERILYKNRLDEIPGIYARMRPIDGAIESVRELSKKYDIYILSSPQWNNTSAWSDKVTWIKKHLSDVCYKRVILTHNKSLCKGDYIIDDRSANGTCDFEGEWLHYGSNTYPDWSSILKYLL